jgi:hypothetical protein
MLNNYINNKDSTMMHHEHMMHDTTGCKIKHHTKKDSAAMKEGYMME